jgi:hypothetical protein
MNEEERRELIALRDTVEDLLEGKDGSWEGTPTKLFKALGDIDLAAVPERPDELTKRLLKLQRAGMTLSVSTGRQREGEKVVRTLRLELR